MKKGRKLLKSLMVGLLSLGGLSLTSCGFFGSSEALEADSGIESFYISENEDGSKTVTITYFDEDKEDDIFTIPAGGSEGIDGVSITMITITQISETECILTIYVANAEEPYYTFTIPTGASVVDISMSKTSSGSSNGTVTVTFSDGTTETTEVYYSSKGEAGFGIVAMSYEWDDSGEEIIGLLIIWSNGDYTRIPINNYQGEDGYSVTSITTSTDYDNGVYHIYITYDYPENAYPEGYDPEYGYDITFAMPENPTTWYNGSGAPSEELGQDGDHYFDIKNIVIYEKKDGEWVVVLSILEYYGKDDKSVTITFDLNDSTQEPAALASVYSPNEDGLYEVEVPYNTYFTSVGSIPLPTRSGYDSSGNSYSYNFMGWCSSKEASPVSGYLTELTACNDDMTYYALWEKN